MELESVLTELLPLDLVVFGSFFFCMVWSLCNQLLLQFSVDVSQTLQTYYGWIEDVHIRF